MIFSRIAESKVISCGIILNDNGMILVGHPTGKRYGPASFDIPKGHLEDGEDPRECAVRELYEETSIKLTNEEINRMKDLGQVKYTSSKDLRLFYLETKVPDVKTLKCISTWDDNGTPRPEINEHRMIPIEDLSLLYKSLQSAVRTALISLL
jgi:8-oxo-dGTP pyrophosphatase MutT (NUDIX family)